jgi:hypothetical protein
MEFTARHVLRVAVFAGTTPDLEYLLSASRL